MSGAMVEHYQWLLELYRLFRLLCLCVIVLNVWNRKILYSNSFIVVMKQPESPAPSILYLYNPIISSYPLGLHVQVWLHPRPLPWWGQWRRWQAHGRRQRHRCLPVVSGASVQWLATADIRGVDVMMSGGNKLKWGLKENSWLMKCHFSSIFHCIREVSDIKADS